MISRHLFFLPVLLSGLCAGTSTATTREDLIQERPSSLSAPVIERIRGERALEELRFNLWRKGNTSEGAAFEETIPESVTRKKVLDILRLRKLLETRWELRITSLDLQREYDRIIANTRDTETLHALFSVLGNDPRAIGNCLLEPLLVKHKVHKLYWWDSEIHGALRRQALDELAADPDGELPAASSGIYTETEYRLDTSGNVPSVEYENGIQIRYLRPPDWQRLLEDATDRWANGDRGRPPALHRASALEETKEYFEAAEILENDAGRLRIRTCTWWKESFSLWWAARAESYAIDVVEITPPIEFGAVSHEGLEKSGERAVTSAWYELNSSDSDTPSARDQHTAIWNGSLMIVWGGTNGAQYFNSGGVYDPATDSWEATSQGTNCPIARIGHSATKIGAKMAIWGGWNGSTNYNTGAIFNASTDTWSTIIVDSDTPTARHGHFGGHPTSGNGFYVWGGRTSINVTQTGANYMFDANPIRWVPMLVDASTPAGREDFPGQWNPTSGEFVFWGGKGGSGYFSDGGKFDINPEEWTAISSSGAPSARFAHTSVMSAIDVCLSPLNYPSSIFWGGFAPYDANSEANTGGIFSAVGTGAWLGSTSTGTDVPSGRYRHTAVMDQWKNWMVVWGGSTSSGVTATGGIYKLCNDSWVPTDTSDSDCPSARSMHTAVWTGKAMLVWGGSNGNTEYGDGGVFTYCWEDPTTSITPVVTDEDPCVASGIRISWSGNVDWNDYAVHRRLSVIRDGSVIASGLAFGDSSYLDTTVAEDESHDYQLRFINSCGNYVTTSSEAGTDISASDPVITLSPTAVDADGCTSGSGIDVSWAQDPGGDWGDNGATGRKYRVWRYQNPVDGWVALGAQLPYGTTSYHDATPGLGSYWIRYINGCGKYADSSPTALVYDLAASAPSVSQTAAAADGDSCSYGGNSITWPQNPDDWGDNSEGDRRYRVRRSLDGVSFSAIGNNISYPATSYLDTTAAADQMYYYEIRYKNGCGLDTDSESDTATDIVVPESPTITVNSSSTDPDKCDDGGIVITWPQDPSTWCDKGSGSRRSYDVLRNSVAIHSGITYGTTTYTDTTGDNGTAYTYSVRYNNKNGLSATTPGSHSNDRPFPPGPLDNNTVADTDLCTAGGVGISWAVDPSTNAWGDGATGTRTYDVLRNGTAIATAIEYGTSTYTDTTGTTGQSYTYKVRYVNGCGLSAATDPGANASDEEGAAPALPANSTAVDPDTCDDGGVNVAWAADASDWGDSGEGERSYDVLRGSTVVAEGVAYGVTGFTDTGGGNGTSYTYTVRYNNGCGQNSTTTGASAADWPTAPASPVNNAARDLSACLESGVFISWAEDPPDSAWGDGGSGARSYSVYRNGTLLAADLPHGVTSITDTSASVGQNNTYTVAYTNGCGIASTTNPGAEATEQTGLPEGDTNADGQKNTDDLESLLQYLFEGTVLLQPDVSCDGTVNSKDTAVLDEILSSGKKSEY